MDFNLAEIHEAIAHHRPDDLCIVFRGRRLTWGEVNERTRRFANFLADQGLGLRAERSELKGHESGQEVGEHVHPFDDREVVREELGTL